MQFLLRSVTTLVLGITALATFAYVLLVGVGLWQGGRDLSGKLLSTFLPDVEITSPQLTWNFNFNIQQLELSDNQGPWLNVNQITIDTSPLKLFNGTIFVKEFDVSSMNVRRLPIEPSESSSQSQHRQSRSRLPFNVSLQNLSINDLSLAPEILGAAAQFSVKADGTFHPSTLYTKLGLNLTRTDQVSGQLEASVLFKPDGSTLDFNVYVREAGGGLFSKVTALPNSPSLTFSFKGGGPIADWKSDLSLLIDDRAAATGFARFRETGGQRQFQAKFTGEIKDLLPASLSNIFEGETTFNTNGVLDNGFLPVKVDFELDSDAITVEGKTRTIENGEKPALDTFLVAKTKTEEPLTFPSANGEILSIVSPEITFSASGPLSNFQWDLSTSTSKVARGPTAFESIFLKASGQNASMAEGNFASDLTTQLEVKALTSSAPKLKGLPQDYFANMEAQLDLQQQSLSIRRFALVSDGLALRSNSGIVSNASTNLNGYLQVSDLSQFSGLAGRALGGDISASFSLISEQNNSTGKVTASIEGYNVQLNEKVLDNLLSRTIQVKLKTNYSLLEPTLSALSLDNTEVTITSNNLSAAGTGFLKKGVVGAQIALQKLALGALDKKLTGNAHLEAKVTGPLNAMEISVDGATQGLMLDGKTNSMLSLTASLTANPEQPSGNFQITGNLAKQEFNMSGQIESQGKQVSANNLSFIMGDNRISGFFSFPDLHSIPAGVTGELQVDAKDLSKIGTIMQLSMQGEAEGTLFLVNHGGKVNAQFLARAQEIQVEDAKVASFSLQGDLFDIFNYPTLSAKMLGEGITSGKFIANEVRLSAEADNHITQFNSSVELANKGQLLKASGSFEAVDDTYDIRLDQVSGVYDQLKINLSQPSLLSIGSSQTNIEKLVFSIGQGRLSLSGNIGTQLAINAGIDRFPLAIANAFSPNLGLKGEVSGTASLQGTLTSPLATWALKGTGISTVALTKQGVSPVASTSSGRFEGRRVQGTLELSNPDGLDFQSQGHIELTSPITVALQATGNVPMQVFNTALTRQSVNAAGKVGISGSVNGPLPTPNIKFTATPQDLVIIDLKHNVTLEEFTGTITADKGAISLNGLSAKLRKGGSISAGGQILLKDHMPADLTVKLSNGRYIDSSLVNALINADISLKGPLTAPDEAPVLSGEVQIQEADIGIPRSFNSSINPVQVTHIETPIPVAKQIALLQKDEGKQEASSKPREPLKLDVTLKAPGKVFVRGRGLYAELGGSIHLGGTTKEPETVGSFDLQRGQFDILNERLSFNKGQVNFTGSLIPNLNFEAISTRSSSTTITVSITGPANNPVVKFSSVPELPEDEIITQLLFGKSATDLSPVQLAQLASTLSTLSGGAADTSFSRFRNLLGASDFNVSVDSSGNPVVSAGTYINDNIYLSASQGTEEEGSEVTVDIDITKQLRLRLGAGSEGSTKSGIYYEKEY
ncbi:translocation/assembly module TamB domain-containing protein [Flexibacterium corallicola]|uniref:translocation/assembly module TamB domain-containing protein n=1 Tax=Flexibacterium corallicola TaxID=3037259 RepID=UPI00286EBEDD|nr:translocation/assembly module TamB domain-containing protein [Pseudovibrio sp. M1P-2-3]